MTKERTEAKVIEYGEDNMPDLLPWDGGECPVTPETMVEVRIRALDDCTLVARADDPQMMWCKCQNPDCEIVGYREVGSA